MKNVLGKIIEDKGYSNKEFVKDDILLVVEVFYFSS